MTHFQDGVDGFMQACFGAAVAADRIERNHRFIEEALELGQACGLSRDEAHQLVDYVFGRPVGERRQEVGGVMVTLAALCNAWSVAGDWKKDGEEIDIETCAATELARCFAKIDVIREKQRRKPKFGPLPGIAMSTARTEVLDDHGKKVEPCPGAEWAWGMIGTKPATICTKCWEQPYRHA